MTETMERDRRVFKRDSGHYLGIFIDRWQGETIYRNGREVGRVSNYLVVVEDRSMGFAWWKAAKALQGVGTL